MNPYKRALCRGEPLKIWFEEAWNDDLQHPKARPGLDRAIALCRACPAMSQCRADHLDEQFGIWFGTTPTERIQLRKERKRKQAA